MTHTYTDFGAAAYEALREDTRETTTPQPAPARPRTATSRGGTVTKNAARRIIDKYTQIASAPDAQRRLLAAVLGAKNDPVDLAVTISSKPRTDMSALDALAHIAEVAQQSPYEAVLSAQSLKRDEAKRVWEVLRHLGLVEGTLPPKEVIAATRISEAAAAIDGDELSVLDGIRDLAKK